MHLRLRSRLEFFVASILALCACGPGVQSDAGADAIADTSRDAVANCRLDVDCDDHVFCNGIERCMPGASGADARGCVPAIAPACLANQRCDETTARCETLCSVAQDADGDGHRAIACGGDDCDDSDANRFPGNTEVCDPMHDEDCDLLTVGARDDDHDTFIAASCCNRTPGANAVCGNDCDDAMEGVHPGVPEVCNGLDDNCNGQIDEGVGRSFFPDMDHDGYGARDSAPVPGCTLAAGQAENSLDCDDTHSTISPVATEVCDGMDNNCNTLVDELPDATIACAASFGSPVNTGFACTAGHCATACSAPWADCDTRLDNGCETDTTSDVNHCGACGTSCGTGGTCRASTCDGVVRTAVGLDYACALRSTGVVVCWGANRFGQLGDGTTVDRPGPTVVAGISGVRAIAVSKYGAVSTGLDACPATCAQSGQLVTCWGCNSRGQLGLGTAGGGATSPGASVIGLPHLFSSGLGTVLGAAAVGGNFACAAEEAPGGSAATSAIYCWGGNQSGQVRTPVSTSVLTPAASLNGSPSAWLTVAAGLAHACGIVSSGAPASGAVSCWGQNDQGQSGATAGAPVAPTPITVPAGFAASSFVQVDTGFAFSCARGGTGGGAVLCWGSNTVGQLGDGTTTTRFQARAVMGITDATDLAVGSGYACAVHATGRVSCWGGGYLGDGTSMRSSVPVDVVGITDAVDVSCGDSTTCVTRSNGHVMCWGRNDAGQVGDGTTATALTPVAVMGL